MATDMATHAITSSTCGVKDGRYSGSGTVTLCNKSEYTGDLHRGKLHGHGQLTWHDSVSYSGAFNGSQMKGTGCYTWPDGGVYRGEVSNGRREGKGVYTKSGLRYLGEWRGGVKHGLGVLYYNTAETHFYEGEFVKGVKQGWGRQQYASGSVYEGQWVGGRMFGYGAMQWVLPGAPTNAAAALQTRAMLALAAEHNTTASFATSQPEDTPNSPCSALFAAPLTPMSTGPANTSSISQDAQTGRIEKFEGEWVDGKPDGYGTYTWLCKSRPRHATTHAQASVVTSVGTSMSNLETPFQGENFYKGWFREGKRHGKGVLCLADGTVFEGIWQNNVKEGSGVLMHADGCVELLTLRANVIEAKRVLFAGTAPRRQGESKVANPLQGLTVHDTLMGDPLGLGIAELLDCNDADKAVELRRVKDLLARHLPQLKLLYKFYAMVGASILIKTPSDARREEARRLRFERLISQRCLEEGAQSCLTATTELHQVQLSAEEAAFRTPAAFLAEHNNEDTTAPRYSSRREVLIRKLNTACQEVSQGANDIAIKVGGADEESGPPPPAVTPGSKQGSAKGFAPLQAPPKLQSHRPAPPSPLHDEAPTGLRLHQLWALLREAQVTDGDMTLHRCNRIIQQLVARQPQERDDLQGLDDVPEDKEPTTEPQQASSEQFDTVSMMSVPRVRSVKSNRTKQTDMSRVSSAADAKSRANTTCESEPSSAVSKDMRNGLVARVRAQQRDDPDDPQLTILFPTMLQCLVRIAHVKAKHTSGHAYANVAKGLTLCDRVNWLFTEFLTPLVEAINNAATSSVGPALCLPRCTPQPCANLSHKSPKQAELALKRTGAKKLNCTTDITFAGTTRPLNVELIKDDSTPVSPSLSCHDSSEGSQESFSISDEVTVIPSSDDKRDTLKAKPTPQKPPLPAAVSAVTVADKAQTCLHEKHMVATVTSTTVTSEPGEAPVTVYVESYRSSTTPLPCHDCVCLGLRSGLQHEQESVLDGKYCRAVQQQQACLDTIEEHQYQTRHKSSDVRERITPSEANRAKALLKTLEMPHRLPLHGVPLRILLLSRPVVEVVAAHSGTLLTLFALYAQDGAMQLRDLLRLLRDFDVHSAAPLETAPNTAEKVATLVCNTILASNTSEANKSYAKEVKKGLLAELRPPSTPLLPQSATCIIRTVLWSLLGVDPDAQCQLRTRGEMAARQKEVAEEVVIAARCTSLATPPEYEEEQRRLLGVSASSTAVAESTIKVDPILRDRLVARDEIKTDPTWFPPAIADSLVTDTWLLAFSTLPLLYHEFTGALGIIACLAYTTPSQPIPSPQEVVNCSYEDELAEKVSRLLGHIEAHPEMKVVLAKKGE